MAKYIIQVIMAVFGAVGFSLIFNIHGKRLIITAVGGALTWGAYVIAYANGTGIFSACLIATMVSMTFAEIMARISKTPVIILLAPMLIPMVPGGDLYRMMANLVMGDSELTRFYGQQLVMEVGAIAFGIIIISSAVQLIARVHQHFQPARH